LIIIVAGGPGSGKSYFAVDYISKFKDKDKVLHNVDGLKLGTPLDTYCHDNDLNPLTLFSNSFHEKDKSFRGWLFVIDECQTLFPKSFKGEDVLRFFQLHRHYGIDIILLSQDYKLICPSIALLAEYQYRAVADVANPLPGTFLYKQLVGYEEVGKKTLRKKKAIFKLYKSADFDQSKTRKKKRPMLLLMGLCAAVVLFGAYKIIDIKNNGIGQSSASTSPPSGKKGYSPPEKASYPGSTGAPVYSEFSSGQYPITLENTFGGRLYPVSHITDHRGTFIPFLGFLFRLEEFPFPVTVTHTGFVAVLPADVFQYAEFYQASIPEPETSTTNFDSGDSHAAQRQATFREKGA
jgi:zona occludens toxin (predicted ATPase)